LKARISVKTFSKAGNVHVHASAVEEGIVAPYLVKSFRSIQNTVTVFQQQLQQVSFPLGKPGSMVFYR
jgi:hypothetical protein